MKRSVSILILGSALGLTAASTDTGSAHAQMAIPRRACHPAAPCGQVPAPRLRWDTSGKYLVFRGGGLEILSSRPTAERYLYML